MSNMETTYFDLGTHTRVVTTTSPEAQRWFDRGLVWLYGFNHEESIACFERALEADPRCAMAHWGIGYAAGPNYNDPWPEDPDGVLVMLEPAHRWSQSALAELAGASHVERALILALAERYPSATADTECSVWSDRYANAMRDVYQANSDDLDIAALFAEALMNRTPWAMWDLASGQPAVGADTLEARAVLEGALSTPAGRTHPGVLHMYVHLIEMSPNPEDALRAADQLRGLVPDAGHLEHMATHIDVLCGHYQDVIDSNTTAIAADLRYLDKEGPLNGYSLYRAHNYHFKLYGAMLAGQLEPALQAADEMTATLPVELLEMDGMADLLESFMPLRMHVLIRFGRWEDIIETALPADRDLMSVSTAIIRYAKGVALAATGRIEESEEQREAFRSAVARVPASRMMFNNTCLDILAVAAEMLDGELEYRRGNLEMAFAHLRRSIELDDQLPYDEPWGWMQPTRHAYGALLLEQGEIEAAEAVYRADLGFDTTLPRAYQHPDNVWSLHGLHECLAGLGKQAEADMVRLRLDLALARTDVEINASCYCRLSTGHA